MAESRNEVYIQKVTPEVKSIEETAYGDRFFNIVLDGLLFICSASALL